MAVALKPATHRILGATPGGSDAGVGRKIHYPDFEKLSEWFDMFTHPLEGSSADTLPMQRMKVAKQTPERQHYSPVL